jgi:hypothetical protein
MIVIHKKYPTQVVRPMPRNVIPMRSAQHLERARVIEYLQGIQVDGMRKHLCFSCAFVTLYDKNNKSYLISRTHTLDQVKNIVEEIRQVNKDVLK